MPDPQKLAEFNKKSIVDRIAGLELPLKERISVLRQISRQAEDKIRELKANKPQMNEKLAAAAIEEAAKEWEEDGVRAYGPKSKKPELEMVECYKRDAASLRIVAAKLQKGEVRLAYNKASMLDTIIREQIPEDVWDFMTGEIDD